MKEILEQSLQFSFKEKSASALQKQMLEHLFQPEQV